MPEDGPKQISLGAHCRPVQGHDSCWCHDDRLSELASRSSNHGSKDDPGAADGSVEVMIYFCYKASVDGWHGALLGLPTCVCARVRVCVCARGWGVCWGGRGGVGGWAPVVGAVVLSARPPPC